jgi:hypothetical protein
VRARARDAEGEKRNERDGDVLVGCNHERTEKTSGDADPFD